MQDSVDRSANIFRCRKNIFLCEMNHLNVKRYLSSLNNDVGKDKVLFCSIGSVLDTPVSMTRRVNFESYKRFNFILFLAVFVLSSYNIYVPELSLISKFPRNLSRPLLFSLIL